ncbi:MAG: protein kinase [Polyangiaceae bacterium]
MSEEDALIGTLVAERYRVVRKLGEGGMGVVYEAVHEALRKPVAMKLLASSGRIDKEAVARFEREAIAAANLRHPNIAEATDFGRLPDGALYLVMEYVEGLTLRRLLRRDGRLPPERALAILEQVGSALTTAHAREVVHRDLKPENIIVARAHGREDFVKVIDFGIARIRNATFGGGATGLTKAGTVFGTPEYMAPEQVMGQPADARADQYALGVLAFELLTGKPPFAADDIGQLMMMHVGAPIPSTRNSAPTLSPAADAVVQRMLAKLPDERFPSVDEAVRALAASLAPASAIPAPTPSQPGTGGTVSLSSLSASGSFTAAGPPSLAGPASQPGTVRLGPSTATDAEATAKTLQSFAFDAAYTQGANTAVLSPGQLPSTTAGPVSARTAPDAPASRSGAHPAASAVTGAHTVTPGSDTGSAAATSMTPAHLRPKPPSKSPLDTVRDALASPTKRMPMLIGLGAGGLLVVLLLVGLVLGLSGGGGSLPPEVVTALADWKNGNVSPAAQAIRTAVAADADLANDVVIARTLAEGAGDEAARAALEDLLHTTALGRSTVMAAALAAVAMRDDAEPRAAALEMLRDRQDLLNAENASRVRLRDAADCEALDAARDEEAEANTPATQRDLERMDHNDCKRILRDPALCDRCSKGSGGGRPPNGLGPVGGPKKPKPKHK